MAKTWLSHALAMLTRYPWRQSKSSPALGMRHPVPVARPLTGDRRAISRRRAPRPHWPYPEPGRD